VPAKQTLKTVLTNMSSTCPGICIVQHIPAHFSRAFADRLNQTCAFEVREAKHGDRIRPSLALVAPSGHHMVLRRASACLAESPALGLCKEVLPLDQMAFIERYANDVAISAASMRAKALFAGRQSSDISQLCHLRRFLLVSFPTG
jgi:hypothetical protein